MLYLDHMPSRRLRAARPTTVVAAFAQLTVLAALTVALGACSARPDAHAAPSTSHPDSLHAAAGEISATKPASAAMFLTGDTIHPHLIPGRSAHDSSSFFGAIRAGRKAVTAWPAAPAALPGAVLPGTRIVAFYGNPLSKRMGVLGEYPKDVMLAKLDSTVALWRQADPSTPVRPALQLIAVVAQGAPGRDGMYRLRMDTSLIEKVYGWAMAKNALLILDVQVGKSTLQAELPRLLPFLARPNVQLAIDPEFSMHYDQEGRLPGTKIGEMSADDVNYAIRTLTDLVQRDHLPPKILVVHRFTQKMVLHSSQIRPNPDVQVVMDMDGWGPPWLKFDSYRAYEVDQPVEYTGFKLFFYNDTKKGNALLTPFEVLRLLPRPLYIQYQ